MHGCFRNYLRDGHRSYQGGYLRGDGANHQCRYWSYRVDRQNQQQRCLSGARASHWDIHRYCCFQRIQDTEVANVHLAVDQTADISVILQLGTAAQTVTVNGSTEGQLATDTSYQQRPNYLNRNVNLRTGQTLNGTAIQYTLPVSAPRLPAGSGRTLLCRIGQGTHLGFAYGDRDSGPERGAWPGPDGLQHLSGEGL